MTNAAFNRITTLQYRYRNAEQIILSFESGAEYRKLQTGKERMRRYYEAELKKKELEIARLNRQCERNMQNWFQVFEDIQKEYEKKLSQKEHIIESLSEKLHKRDETVEKQKKKITF